MLRALFATAAVVFVISARAEIAVRDASGAEVRLPAPAMRIVSLAPHITEMLFAAGAGDHVVGTVEYSDYPPPAKRIARVGSYSNLDLESIVALRADLVIGWRSGNTMSSREAFAALHIPVFWSEPARLEDVADDLERFGQLAGTSGVAGPAATAYRLRLEALRHRYSGRPPVRTFFQIWGEPPITVGEHQIINSVIRLCGGVNVFGDLQALAPAVSVEAVLVADPEVIVASGMDTERPSWLDAWRRWPRLTAPARDNLFVIPPDLIERHTPRLLDGADRLCRDLEAARDRRPPP